MGLLADLYVDNGMTLSMDMATTVHTCPLCGAEWEEFIDRDPIGIGTVWYAHDFDLTRSYPIHRGFCRACAMETASMEDRVAYLRDNDLLHEFFASLIHSDVMERLSHRDILAVWAAALRCDADVLDQRLTEYIEDHHEDDFIAWRCGYD